MLIYIFKYSTYMVNLANETKKVATRFDGRSPKLSPHPI